MVIVEQLVLVAILVLTTLQEGMADEPASLGSKQWRGESRANIVGNGDCQQEPQQVLPLQRLKSRIGPAVALAFDGQILTAAGWSGVCSWDLSTGREVQHWENSEWWIQGLSPDGRMAVVSQFREKIRVLQAATGKELLRFSDSYNLCARTYPFIFSPDGQTMFADCSIPEEGYCLILWDVATGRQLSQVARSGSPICLALSPDHKTVALGGSGTDIHLYDLTSQSLRAKIGEPRVPHPADIGGYVGALPTRGVAITSVAFAPDGKALAAGNCDGHIDIYGVATGKRRLHLGGPALPLRDIRMPFVSSLLFASDGNTLVALDSYRTPTVERKIHLWELASGTEICQLEGPQGKLNAVALSADSRILAVGSDDGTVLMWDVASLVLGREAKPIHLSASEMLMLWMELARFETLRAQRALWTLVAAGDQAAPFFEEWIQSESRGDEIPRLVAALDNKRFSVRHNALLRLEELGDQVEPALRQVLAGKPSPEVRREVEHLLMKLQGPTTSQRRLRAIRGTLVLEHIGTPRTNRLLETVSQGPSGTVWTQCAKGALERLAKRRAVDP